MSDEFLDPLGALVEQSLLVRELGPEGEPRFRMLETIREYGLEQLETNIEEAAAVRAAHAHYFLHFVQSLRPLVTTRSTHEPHDRLAADDANLRAAIVWLDEHGEAADLANMVAACCVFWRVVGHLQEAEAWIQRALANRDLVPATERARLLIGWAELLLVRGEAMRANSVYEEGIPLLRGEGDAFDLAMALISYGVSLNHCGTYAEADSQLREGLSLAETIADRRLQAAVAGRALANLSDSARGLGDLDLAMSCSEEALRRYHGHNLEFAENRTLLDLGNIARDQGTYRLAVERYLLVIERTGERGVMRLVADGLAGIASAATIWGQTRAALLLFGAADALHERVGIGMTFPIDAARVDRDLALLRDTVGDEQASATLAAGRALSLAEAIDVATAVLPPDGSPAASRAGAQETLTRRERDVLQLMAKWHTDSQIAEALFLSTRTVSWHVRSILAKLGAASRREAVAHARAEGLISP